MSTVQSFLQSGTYSKFPRRSFQYQHTTNDLEKKCLSQANLQVSKNVDGVASVVFEDWQITVKIRKALISSGAKCYNGQWSTLTQV